MRTSTINQKRGLKMKVFKRMFLSLLTIFALSFTIPAQAVNYTSHDAQSIDYESHDHNGVALASVKAKKQTASASKMPVDYLYSYSSTSTAKHSQTFTYNESEIGAGSGGDKLIGNCGSCHERQLSPT